MKKAKLFFCLFIWLLASNLTAQKTSLNGSPIVIVKDPNIWVLENSKDRLVFGAVSHDLMAGYDDLWLYYYNKSSKTTESQKFDDNLEGRFAYLKDGIVHLIGVRNNNKTKSLDYVDGTIQEGSGTVKKMPFTTKCSVPYEKHKLYFNQFAFSPDKSKIAILTVLHPKSNSDISHIQDVAVFDLNGEMLYHHRQNVNYQINYNSPILVSNDGVAYIAEYGCAENVRRNISDSLHISVYSEKGIVNITDFFGTKSEFRCAKALLNDGRLAVSGVVCNNGKSSGVLSTYLVSEDGNFDLVKSPVNLPIDAEDYVYNGAQYHDSVDRFLPYIHEIKELPDGKIMLIGELNYRDIIGQIISLTGPSYWIRGYLSRNLYKIMLSSDGKVTDVSTYPRATVTTEVYSMYLRVNTPGVFIRNNDVYLLFNDHKDNFDNNHQRLWTVLNNNRAGETVVVLSKVEKNNSLSCDVIYTAQPYPFPRQAIYTNHYEFFDRILTTDEDAVYYILKHDNEYRLETITW